MQSPSLVSYKVLLENTLLSTAYTFNTCIMEVFMWKENLLGDFSSSSLGSAFSAFGGPLILYINERSLPVKEESSSSSSSSSSGIP